MGERSNPNNCASCRHKQNPDGGHCYMFRFEPAEMCAHHTSQIHALQALRSSGQCAYPSDLDSDRDNLLITKEVFAFRRLENRAIC